MAVGNYIFDYGKLHFFDKSGAELPLTKTSSLNMTSMYYNDKNAEGICITDESGNIFTSSMTEWGLMDMETLGTDSNTIPFKLTYTDSSNNSYTCEFDPNAGSMVRIPISALAGNTSISYYAIQDISINTPIVLETSWLDSSENVVSPSLPFPSLTIS